MVKQSDMPLYLKIPYVIKKYAPNRVNLYSLHLSVKIGLVKIYKDWTSHDLQKLHLSRFHKHKFVQKFVKQ